MEFRETEPSQTPGSRSAGREFAQLFYARQPGWMSGELAGGRLTSQAWEREACVGSRTTTGAKPLVAGDRSGGPDRDLNPFLDAFPADTLGSLCAAW
jgi:hypothetical protein